MGVEIEAKIRVSAHDEVRRRLEAAGAVRAGVVIETNTFFDTPDQKLLYGDCGLRTRSARDVVSGETVHTTTYKGPRQSGPLKRREELETAVGDAEVLGLLYHRLGYEITLSFEKRRESWDLADCRVELDTLPLIGRYVEVEGPDEKAVVRVLTTLGLVNETRIGDSYVAMLAEKLSERESPDRVLRLPPEELKP